MGFGNGATEGQRLLLVILRLQARQGEDRNLLQRHAIQAVEVVRGLAEKSGDCDESGNARVGWMAISEPTNPPTSVREPWANAGARTLSFVE